MARIREEMFAIDPSCYYCRCQIVLRCDDMLLRNMATLDHKTPKSRGGHKTSKRNLVLCCLGCNCDKGDRTEEEYRSGMKQLTDA